MFWESEPEPEVDKRTFADVMNQHGSATNAIVNELLGPMPFATGLKIMEQAIRELALKAKEETR